MPPSNSRTESAITRAMSQSFVRSCAACPLSSAAPRLPSKATRKLNGADIYGSDCRGARPRIVAFPPSAWCGVGIGATSKASRRRCNKLLRLVSRRTNRPCFSSPARLRAVAAVRGVRLKAMCPRCSRAVVHRDDARLRCHHCGHAAALPASCPDCGNQDLLPLGFGTQRLERALAELFPGARVLRVDRDSTRRRGSFVAMRDAIAAGEVDILVGTQMLAKGHDFPRMTLVGVLGADNALYSAEFRATERLFALLEQVAGRAGRGEMVGEVLVQTDFPDHPLYKALIGHDYDRYAGALLAERRGLGLPPFAYLALLAAEAKTRGPMMSFLDAAAERGRAVIAANACRCQLYPPVPAGLARRAGMERGQVLVQSNDRRSLQTFLPLWRAELEQLAERRVRWSIDVDPLSFA